MGIPDSDVTACLIVRDEQHQLPGCLASLDGLVAAVVVYDTGSTDATADIAERAGATVIRGYWDDDFSRARNAALAAATTPWVLSIDADERLVADGSLVIGASREADALRTEIRNITGADGSDSYSSFSPRVFRRSAAVWQGRIHEQIVAIDAPLRFAELSPAGPPVASLSHLGYLDPVEARGKAARNATLGRAELTLLMSTPRPDPAQLARVLLDLGRSLMACDQRQGAIDAFQAVRDLPTAGPEFAQATDFMARLALGENQPDDADCLIEQLRETGAAVHYCDWLQAQVLAQRGDAGGARRLLATITSLVDPAGRTYGFGSVVEMQALAAALDGDHREALAHLVDAMARYGRVAGRGKLLLEWAGNDALEDIWPLFHQTTSPAVLDAIRRELATCHIPVG